MQTDSDGTNIIKINKIIKKKTNITLYSERLKISDKDHKLIRKVHTELTDLISHLQKLCPSFTYSL